MLVTGAEVPHLCAQCEDHPCVDSFPMDAMSVNPEMKSIEVDREKYTACGNCIAAYSGRVPHIQPAEGYAPICDFCGGDPQCVRACYDGRWGCLYLVKREEPTPTGP